MSPLFKITANYQMNETYQMYKTLVITLLYVLFGTVQSTWLRGQSRESCNFSPENRDVKTIIQNQKSVT